MNNSDVDILCLQEVYFADTQRQIYRSLRHKYPYAVSALDLSVEDVNTQMPACSVQEGTVFQQCVHTQCAGITGFQLGGCVVLR